MGGLVAAAPPIRAGTGRSHRPPSSPRHTSSGSPVEKSVHLGDWGHAQGAGDPTSGEFLTRRSVGIKDLRFGAIAQG